MCQNNPEKKIYIFFSLYYQMKDKQILEAHNGFPDCYALCGVHAVVAKLPAAKVVLL